MSTNSRTKNKAALPLQDGPFTGKAINPARVFGPAVVFNCYWDSAFIYMLAQYCGGIIAREGKEARCANPQALPSSAHQGRSTGASVVVTND